jgi:dihydrofolate reductase
MNISIIAAMGEQRVIGSNGALPWNMPADMRRFRSCTIGKPIVMGSKTYASIGHPLSERENIILTHDKTYVADGCCIMNSPEEIMKKYAEVSELMIIGGASVYATFLPHTDTMYLTHIKNVFKGDTYFPLFNQKEWREVSREEHDADEENNYPYVFTTLKRIAHENLYKTDR